MNRFVVVVSFPGLGMGLEIVSSCLIPSTPPVPLCFVFSKKVALFPGLPWPSLAFPGLPRYGARNSPGIGLLIFARGISSFQVGHHYKLLSRSQLSDTQPHPNCLCFVFTLIHRRDSLVPPLFLPSVFTFHFYFQFVFIIQGSRKSSKIGKGLVSFIT